MDADGAATRTLRLDLAYEGTHYHGFGRQPNRRTVQEVLEEALARSLGEQVRVTPAGRTDAGVHADGQVVSFTTRGRLAPPELLRAVNAYLPHDVLVHGAATMPPTFDARRSALRRHYRYLIWRRRLPHLWWRRWAWHQTDRLDLAAMQAAADRLVGTSDFGSFAGHRSQDPAGRTTTRTVERAQWWQDGSLIGFEITANAFLRHMVRGMVGTLVEVGRGRLDPAQFSAIVQAGDRRQAGPNAPPHGLTLVRVDYPAQFEAAVDESAAQEPYSGFPGRAWCPGSPGNHIGPILHPC
ncbi:MAG: tRNA pseudouridine(38-40) synthase TruA [Chloroflexi bacterium]|nr:tRNA pseudouridine(38-40) synthase TruA [Chloroflexota bacterium]